MIRWPWKRPDAHRDELSEARQRLAQDNARLERQSRASRFAAARLARAAAAEQAEIRKNHLAETIHSALALSHERHPR